MVNILIIDDSAFQREIIKSKISSFGFSISTASNGIEGLNKIKEIEPDVIILDILMPEMNGLEFIKEIQKKNPNIPIIVNSADIQDTTKLECISLGAFAFLNKPLKKQEIYDTINKALEREK
jgi:two-component system, chemotaxis family, chemotaxis protein CheY